MKRLLFSILLIYISTCYIGAQIQIFDTLNRDQYLARVKLLDEFFARFNGEEIRNDVTEEYRNRESGILLLFDLSQFQSKQDSTFVMAENFAHFVVQNKSKLNFEDKNWFARIKCHGKLGKEKVSFFMFLCVEERDSSMYRWAISNVEGNIFLNSRDYPHNELFIMPNDNEQFFQSIRKITSETYEYIDDYVKKEYKADALSTFLTLVRSNQLKIEAVTDIEFVFLQVPGYMFKVIYFDRNNKNAGWLICSCTKLSEEGKEKILKKIYQ